MKHDYQSYLLRIWQTAPAKSAQGTPQPTFVLEEIQSGKRVGFRTTHELTQFLNQQNAMLNTTRRHA